MTPLTIHLLIQNNEETITQALESILPLKANIVVADIGCCDKTAQICKSYNLSVVKINGTDRSKIRNELVSQSKTEWQFYIEPWEILLSGHEIFDSLVNEKSYAYHCEVLQSEIITKQIRLWKKDTLHFTNPIFETLKDENSAHAEVILYLENKEWPDGKQIEKWKKSNPLATDPYYYQACWQLFKKNYKEFLSLSEHYLFKERQQTISATMTRYYTGIVNCLVTNDLEIATRNALLCVAAHPLMAEFWCLLGDAYFQAREFEKSMTFYDNAMLLGKRRLRGDRWPMHISKYDEYPKEMIESCKKVLANSSQFYVNKNQSQ